MVLEGLLLVYKRLYLDEFKIAKNVASDTAEMLKANFLSNPGVLKNKGKDIKTEADFAAHEYIYEILSKTGIPIISEEGKNKKFYLADHQWIVDPIDGTLNLSRGFEMSAISISLWNRGIPTFGVVHSLFSNEVFTSFQERGSYKGNHKISVSETKQKNNAILATGFSSGRDYSQKSLDEFVINVQNYKKIRMLGSAALMLAYVSCGVFDVYYEQDIYIWDVAAGLSLVLEAGGSYLITPGNDLFKYNVIASNKILISSV